MSIPRNRRIRFIRGSAGRQLGDEGGANVFRFVSMRPNRAGLKKVRHGGHAFGRNAYRAVEFSLTS